MYQYKPVCTIQVKHLSSMYQYKQVHTYLYLFKQFENIVCTSTKQYILVCTSELQAIKITYWYVLVCTYLENPGEFPVPQS